MPRNEKIVCLFPQPPTVPAINQNVNCIAPHLARIQGGVKLANSWVRLWIDMPTDPKWRAIARVSGQPISLVISVFVYLMTEAGNAVKRGETQCNARNAIETYATALDEKEESVEAVLDAMQGRVLDGAILIGWEKRQPKREDSSTARVKKYRETQCNAEKRNVTLDKDKDTDKNKDLNPSVTDISFGQFWEAYPKKRGKGAAERAWKKIRKPTELLPEILGAIASQKNADQWTRDGGQYIPNPATWLNERRWEDELEQSAPKYNPMMLGDRVVR